MAFFSEATMTIANRIPAPVWRFCCRELQLFELHKKAIALRKSEIISEYSSHDISDEPQTGGGSIYSTKTIRAVEKLTAADLIELEKSVQMIEDVLQALTPLQRKFYQVHFREGNDIISCSRLMAYSQRKVNYLKREVVEMVAVRHGFMR